MTGARAQSASQVEGPHLVLYDGVCGLCSRLLQFLLAHDRRGVFRFASLQSAIGRDIVARCGGNGGELTTFYVLPDYRGDNPRLLSRSAAALFVAGALGWPWKALAFLRVLPAVLLDGLYNLVARNRYRFFGRREQCLLPSPESRHRFID